MQDIQQLRRRAFALAARGHYRQGAETYEHILMLSPNDADAALRSGELRRKAGDLLGAKRRFCQAAELFRFLGMREKADAAARAAQHISERKTQPGMAVPERSRWWHGFLAAIRA